MATSLPGISSRWTKVLRGIDVIKVSANARIKTRQEIHVFGGSSQPAMMSGRDRMLTP